MSVIDRMTAAEIRKMYRDAKNKKKQLCILAELNGCKPADIRAIINGETDELPPLKATKKYSHLTEEDKQKILQLYREGISKSEIGRRTGRSESSITKTIKEAEMTFTEEQTPEQNEQLLQEITEKITDKPMTEIPSIPTEGVGVVEIAGALLDFVANDLHDHIVEIKYSKDGYTVRVEGESEGAVLTRRHEK